MPSTTPEQQRLFGQAYAIKTGKMKPSDLNPEYRDQIVKLADSMTKDQLKDYAETKHSEMKKENNIPTFEEFLNESTKVNEGHPSTDPYAYYDTMKDLKQDLESLEAYWKGQKMPEWAERKKKFLEDGIKNKVRK